ncbi:potassium transporter [Ochrobactrum sp. MYb15]|uniref:monovalent cation:proton antiporter-2 (CPA2) family protein n=1 Tax=Brucella TaxID=234 RepID=UPI000463718E|nr:monovalent cation:proton antiporter-2 (CPA2) family protein [Brucella rhizosphaerae]PQZ50683.1 potassium transporter [Ochrobactrum sp. MYb19]PRA68723.1 potassium transporter [Ochrobactrum sp. MYb18]PRA74050.1 potassium transporter [Brucella thiophenivorans]PRA90975.1 potassium transporter [Ochrobactrum sp. MYb14]PRA96425.1 potassium transporter [Ochrobactrum sp. MYb15]
MATEGLGQTLGPAVVLLAAGVVAVPLFRKLGLGSVLGYFAAGALVGPSVLGFFTDPATILHFSELGVVMFLFVIGLEMRPGKLWTMRQQIFGLGLAQVLGCIVLLTGTGVLLGLSPITALIAGAGFVLSSTAVIMSILQERGEIATSDGQKAVSILLLEDLMIVPLLALVAFLSPSQHESGGILGIATAIGAILLLIAVGRWLLDPFFSLLARARAREVLTAGALIVVLGAALLMEASGLSMAMGAFLAGVMLSGSSYRHQIESDIEPFKGLLMGLFFLAVGMSLDLGVVASDWSTVLIFLIAYVITKAIGIYAVARIFGSSHRSALERTLLFAQGGEFAFVLYTSAFGNGLLSARDNALFSTVIILSMAVTPFVLLLGSRLLRDEAPSLEGVESAHNLKGRVLMIGFGRFGQIAAQLLLAQRSDVSIIEADPNRIREAGRFGFKIFYGDGSRLDILHHSGADEAEVVMICVDDRKTANRIVDLVKSHFPAAKIMVRSFDRTHSIELLKAGVDFELRETFESALLFGKEALCELGLDESLAEDTLRDIRMRDAERLTAQVQGDLYSGLEQLHTGVPVPEPLTPPGKITKLAGEEG